MSLLAKTLAAMVEAGCTSEQLLAVARVIEQDEKEDQDRLREQWRNKKRRQREMKDVPQCPPMSRGQQGTLGDPSFSPSNGFSPSVLYNINTPSSLTSPLSPLKKENLKRKKDDFVHFWNAYPRKVGKGAAYKAWEKAVDKVEPETIIAKIQQWKSSVDFPDPDFIPHASTWLNQERWHDEYSDQKKIPTQAERDAFKREHEERMKELWQNEKHN